MPALSIGGVLSVNTVSLVVVMAEGVYGNGSGCGVDFDVGIGVG